LTDVQKLVKSSFLDSIFESFAVIDR